jgi:hypothetical protein
MTRWQRTALACALTLFAACDGDEPSQPEPGMPVAPVGAGNDGANAAPIPLVLWVDSMIEAGENARPDTVHDKNIADDQNDAPYGKYFGK